MRNLKLKNLRGTQSIILLLLFFLAFSIDSEAQYISRSAAYPTGTTFNNCSQIDADDMCNCTITLPDIDPATGYTLNINEVIGTLTQAVDDVKITINGACTHTSIIIVDGSPTGSITFPALPDASISSCVIEFEVTATTNEPPTDDCVNFQIQYQSAADPLKLGLVLDISGSMYSSVYSPSGTGPSRWDVLQNAVNSFMTKLESYDNPGDLVGLTYFTTTEISSNSPLGENMITTDGSQAIISTDMGTPRHPLSLTAMGLGLEKGNAIIDNNATTGKEVIILFTDGLQNVTPLVETIGTVTNIGTNEFNADKSVDCYCIAMDITGGVVPVLLSDLATANGGLAYKTANGSESTLMDDFDEILVEIYNGSSPQIVSKQTGKLENGSQSFAFNINDKISNIIFELNYAFGDSIDIVSIEKDKTNLTSAFTFNRSINGNYIICSLELPYSEGATEFFPKGEWMVTVSGTSPNPFKIKCFVDDHNFDYKCLTDKPSYTVGDTINLTSQLFLNKTILKDPVNKVSAIILKPGEDLGDLLATTETPDFQADSLGDISQTALKLNELLKDESFIAKLLEEEILTEMIQDENGNFSGSYFDTKISGVYQVIFFIEAEDKENGIYIRTIRKSVVFKFGMPDLDETDFDIDVSQGDNGQTFVINIRPKNKFGYYLGPGFSSYLKLNLDTLEGVTSKVKDNLDGSYTYTLTNVPDNVTAKDVSISIFGQKIAGEDSCYPVTIWYYIILLVILLIIILIRGIKAKWFKILIWIIFIVWVAYIVLRYLQIICYEFL